MQQWPYAKEPFDTKLFILLFLKKIWLVICAALVGAVLLGGGYYLKKVVFGGPTEYEITTTYFVEYNTYDEETGELFHYTNSASWESWVVTDWFVDRTWEHALEAGLIPERFGVEKSALKGYFYATMPTDLRIPEATVTTPSQELTERLNDALQLTFMDFAEEQPEMEEIRIIDETPLAVADKDVRILRAVILGAVLGAFAAGFGLAVATIWDDSIVLPESFTYRYGLPMAGFWGKGEKALPEEALLNVRYLFRERKNNGLVVLGKGIDTEQISALLPEGLFQKGISAAALGEMDYERLRDAGGILLLVEAGAQNGKEIEHVLHELKLQDCTVTGALLCNGDNKLIARYRLGKIR